MKQPYFPNTPVTPILGFRHSRGNDPKSEERNTDRAEPRGEEKISQAHGILQASLGNSHVDREGCL